MSTIPQKLAIKWRTSFVVKPCLKWSVRYPHNSTLTSLKLCCSFVVCSCLITLTFYFITLTFYLRISTLVFGWGHGIIKSLHSVPRRPVGSRCSCAASSSTPTWSRWVPLRSQFGLSRSALVQSDGCWSMTCACVCVCVNVCVSSVTGWSVGEGGGAACLPLAWPLWTCWTFSPWNVVSGRTCSRCCCCCRLHVRSDLKLRMCGWVGGGGARLSQWAAWMGQTPPPLRCSPLPHPTPNPLWKPGLPPHPLPPPPRSRWVVTWSLFPRPSLPLFSTRVAAVARGRPKHTIVKPLSHVAVHVRAS